MPRNCVKVCERAPAAADGDTVFRYTGEITGNARLGIPPLRMNDGPQGFRTSDALSGTSTGWPSALTLAATFDTQLASEWGHAMGQEFRDKGAGMQLGPGVNVARLPECGRNFECPAPSIAPPMPFAF